MTKIKITILKFDLQALRRSHSETFLRKGMAVVGMDKKAKLMDKKAKEDKEEEDELSPRAWTVAFFLRWYSRVVFPLSFLIFTIV